MRYAWSQLNAMRRTMSDSKTTYAEMRCTEEQLTNGDADYMSMNNLTYTGKVKKPKPIKDIEADLTKLAAQRVQS